AAQQPDELSIRQSQQSVDASPREQRRDDLKRGILRGGADEDDVSHLDVRKKGVLLSLVESMHFVYKDNCAAARAARMLRSGHDVFDLADAAEHSAEGDKFGMRAARDEPRQRGLAAAGRAPKDHRAK